MLYWEKSVKNKYLLIIFKNIVKLEIDDGNRNLLFDYIFWI